MTGKPNLSKDSHSANLPNGSTARSLSIGDSIALVGVWLISAACLVFLALLNYTDILNTRPPSGEPSEMGVLLLLVITFSPGIFACWVTHKILNKD